MIRSLRRKFILINLLLVGLVLAVVFGVLVGSNAQRLGEQSRVSLRMALEWADGGSPPRFEIASPPDGWEPDRSGRENKAQHFSMVPVFVVTVEDGRVTAINDGGQVAVSDEVASQAVQEVLSSGSGQGVLRGLSLRFQVEHGSGGASRIAFADCSWESASLRNLVLTCLLVWALAMVGFFFISLFLASLAVRPVEKAWKQQRQFVADASHELKTPLTVILANTGIVLSHKENTVSSQAKWLEYTREEAARMKGLVDDLLFLAKSDDARRTTRPLEVSLSELALGCLLPFESVAFEAGVSLESAIAPGVSVLGDEGQLRRLVMILLDNAVKYAGSGGRAALTLVRQQDKVRLTVHNTGAPIPAEHLPHLFERFYRVDAARDRAQGGYGPGLAIAKSVAETHHGKITVSSSAGTGTCFTVVLPRK